MDTIRGMCLKSIYLPMDPIEIRPLDLIVISLYLMGMVGVGIWFSKRNNSTEEYFVGGRAFPGWAIGLSMLGTSISSVTFLAFPAAAFVLDWRQFTSRPPTGSSGIY